MNIPIEQQSQTTVTNCDRLQVPAWLLPPPVDCDAAELAAESEAVQLEPILPPGDFAIIRLEPSQGCQPATPPKGCEDWIARKGADGRWGCDRPGQPVAERWWQRFSFEELPE